MTNKAELYNAYRALVNEKKLPHRVIKNIVDESKTFLLGDGFERKISILSNDASNQALINSKLEKCNFYRVLNQAVLDGFIYEGYIDYSEDILRSVSSEDVSQVYYDPSNPYSIVYLRETRKLFDPLTNSYKYLEVEHSLELTDEQLDLANLLEEQNYKYVCKVEGKEPIVFDYDYIPITRIVLDLDNLETVSIVETLIHHQLEYNDLRARINESNKQHKPQMYSIGTSMPKIIGRTNRSKPQAIDTPSGATVFQTSYETAESSIIHLEISNNASDAGITPKLGYAQPVDSLILERQTERILQELYDNSGVPTVLELQNARSASSSSSLSVMYEPLLRRTRKRAENLIPAIKKILEKLKIDNYTIKLPNMMPKNIEAEQLELEKVKNKVISRRSFLLQSGMTVEQAEVELTNLENERTLAVQFSGVITDSQDAPNVNNNSIVDTLDGELDINNSIKETI